MTKDRANAVGLCLAGKYILLEDDTTIPIVGMLDGSGDDTIECEKCAVAIFELPNGRFSGVYVSQFDADMLIKVSA